MLNIITLVIQVLYFNNKYEEEGIVVRINIVYVICILFLINNNTFVIRLGLIIIILY